ncbi:MAG: ApaG domain-containing protein, partial [Planctomycetota bacterium]
MNQPPFDPDGAHGPAPAGALPLLEEQGDPAHASDTLTHRGGVRVRVRVQPFFAHEEDDAYVFAYRVRITNEGETTVQLLTRHWVFTDGDGGRHEVKGEGVVGR